MDCPQLAVAKHSDLAVNVGADPAGLAHRVENPPYGFDVGVFAPDEQQHVAANGRIDRTGDRRGKGAPCSRPRPITERLAKAIRIAFARAAPRVMPRRAR